MRNSCSFCKQEEDAVQGPETEFWRGYNQKNKKFLYVPNNRLKKGGSRDLGLFLRLISISLFKMLKIDLGNSKIAFFILVKKKKSPYIPNNCVKKWDSLGNSVFLRFWLISFFKMLKNGLGGSKIAFFLLVKKRNPHTSPIIA